MKKKTNCTLVSLGLADLNNRGTSGPRAAIVSKARPVLGQVQKMTQRSMEGLTKAVY